MSDVHVDAVALRSRADAATFASLPLPLAQRVFLALPADARGRACCVCRAWRDALADPSLWARLDLSAMDAEGQRFHVVWRGAAGRAYGQLRLLDLSQEDVALHALLPVLAANAGSLRELHLRSVDDEGDLHAMCPTVEAVVAAAPLLQVLTAEDAHCSGEHAPRMLRAEPPFAPLQIRRSLHVSFSGADYDGGIENFAPFAALADAALQPGLSQVRLLNAHTWYPAVVDALVDAALARRLRELALQNCTPPAAAPLARLFAEGSLTVFEFYDSGGLLFDAADAVLLGDALRVNTTLTKLDLSCPDFCVDTRSAELLLGALVGHPSLCELWITCNEDLDATEFGAALAALIAADAPALETFNCSSNSLEDAGLAPIVEALALNRHLRELNVGRNGMSEAFARERLLPAVRANTTLRWLTCANDDDEPEPDAVEEAEELVRLRGQRA